MLARLLKYFFDTDMQHCSHFAGKERKIFADMMERPVIAKTPNHIVLDRCLSPMRRRLRRSVSPRRPVAGIAIGSTGSGHMQRLSPVRVSEAAGGCSEPGA